MPAVALSIAFALLLIAGSAAAADSRLADMVLAEVGSTPVMLSDVALARTLGVLGLAPSDASITEAELDRYLDAQLALREAGQLEIQVPPADVDRAWQAAGGSTLATRLEAVAVDPAWARR